VDLGKLNASEIDRLVEINVAGHDLKHNEFYWAEGATDDGEDHYSGFLCPRCGRPGDPDEGSSEPCVKRYTLSLDWVLGLLDKMCSHMVVTYYAYGHAEADYWDGDEHYYGQGATPARAACEAILRACGELKQEP
jgi:hypothetical protein